LTEKSLSKNHHGVIIKEINADGQMTGKEWWYWHLNNIPDELKTAAEKKVPIKSGTLLGQVVKWKSRKYPEVSSFDHLHFEIRNKEPDGKVTALNPFTECSLPDLNSPTLNGIYFVSGW